MGAPLGAARVRARAAAKNMALLLRVCEKPPSDYHRFAVRAPDPEPLFRQSRVSVRPWPVTVVCLAGGLLLVGTWLHAARGSQARTFGPGYWPYLIVTTGALAFALRGLVGGDAGGLAAPPRRTPPRRRGGGGDG